MLDQIEVIIMMMYKEQKVSKTDFKYIFHIDY